MVRVVEESCIRDFRPCVKLGEKKMMEERCLVVSPGMKQQVS